jgi:hypothetical protein
MKKIISFSLSLTLFTTWVLTDQNPHQFQKYASVINSGGASPGKTGAPGESNCTMCHSGSVNDGFGVSSISFSGLNNEYIPGTTYDLSLSLNNGSSKNGFQLVVLDSITESNAGTIMVSDVVNTQISSGNNRTYLNHTSAGNSLNLWDFQWTAPASDVGPIKIYYAYNVAGYPYTNTSGDLIYTNHITLSPSNSTITCNNEFLDFQCYVVNQNQLNIISNINSSEKSIIKIYNMIGKEVFIKKLNFFNNQTFQLSLPSNLTSGTYIVSLKVGKEIKNQKIIF